MIYYLSVIIICFGPRQIVCGCLGGGEKPPQVRYFMDDKGRTSGDGGATGYDWPDCTIPYYIDPHSYDYNSQQKIKQVMQEQYHQKTCIRFRPWLQTDTNWIEIKHIYNGCSALVGMQRSGGQLVNLAPNCIYDVIITHELMHAVGFNHQHAAYNRDDYIVVHWENIAEKQKYNFNKEKREDNQDGPYGFDFTSAMMYGRLAFSKNQQPTIDARPPYTFTQDLYGNDYGLVEKDIQKIRLRYQNTCDCYRNSWNTLANGTNPDTDNNVAPTTVNTTEKSPFMKLPFIKLPIKIPIKFPF